LISHTSPRDGFILAAAGFCGFFIVQIVSQAVIPQLTFSDFLLPLGRVIFQGCERGIRLIEDARSTILFNGGSNNIGDLLASNFGELSKDALRALAHPHRRTALRLFHGKSVPATATKTIYILVYIVGYYNKLRCLLMLQRM
jgi:hypothetical protein